MQTPALIVVQMSAIGEYSPLQTVVLSVRV
jgi:hypothetical protein